MKPAILFCILVIFQNAVAQSPAELQKQFLDQLNSVLSSSPQHHWAYEGEKMTIDSPFAVNNGLLSVTLKYSNDSSYHRVRYATPLNTITHVTQDVYLILETKGMMVDIFEMEAGKNEWTKILRRNYFHIGIVGENPLPTENVRHILSLLLKNKEIAPKEYFFRDYAVADKDFSEGLKAVERDEVYGFMNLEREIAIGFQFEEARDFSEGLAAVKKNGKWGFINAKGALVIPCTYKGVYDFQEGKARVFVKNKSYFIDQNGKKVKP